MSYRGQASAYRTHRRTDGRTDGHTDRQTDAGKDNTRRPKVASGKDDSIDFKIPNRCSLNESHNKSAVSLERKLFCSKGDSTVIYGSVV